MNIAVQITDKAKTVLVSVPVDMSQLQEARALLIQACCDHPALKLRAVQLASVFVDLMDPRENGLLFARLGAVFASLIPQEVVAFQWSAAVMINLETVRWQLLGVSGETSGVTWKDLERLAESCSCS